MRCEILKYVSDKLKLCGEMEIEYGHKFDQIKSDSHQLKDLTSRKDYKHTKMISIQVEKNSYF